MNTRNTDFTPLQVLRRRAERSIKNADRYVQASEDILVEYDYNFYEFAANVAHALRRKIVYRTDGGLFARALVRASGDLEKIHNAYMATDAPEGPIRLKVIFVRRQDSVPPYRWMMSLRFLAPDWIDGDEEVIAPDDSRVVSARCMALEKIHVCLEQAAKNIAGLPGKRARKMLDIANTVDCPKSLDLWYYNRAAAFKFFTWRTGDAERDRMSAKTSGKMPFEGNAGTNFGEWRIFPFLVMVQKFHAHSVDNCDPAFKVELEFHEDQIARTFHDINKELDQAGVAIGILNQLPNGALAMWGKGEPFLRHLMKLQETKDHLYSAFK